MTGLFSRRHRGGLRQRLLWTGLVFLGLALFTNTLAGFLYSRAQIKKAAAHIQTEISSRVASDIGDTITHKKERLLDLAGSLAVHEFGSDVQKLVAFLLLKNDSAFTDIAVMDGTGMEIIKVSERRVYVASDLSDQRESEKFYKALWGDDYVSPVYTSDKAEPYVTIAVPVRLGPKKVIGVVSGELNLKFLWSIIGDIKFASAGYAYLVDHKGDLIAYKDASLVLKRTNLSQIPRVQEFLRAASAKDPAPAREGEGITGQPVLSTFARVEALGWAVILEEPVEAALAGFYKLIRHALLLLVGGLFVGGLIIVWMSNKITEPIRELHRGAEIIAAGNLDHRVAVQTGDEIQQLAEGFNKMASALKGSYVTLEEKVEQRTKELSVLYDVTATVNRTLELEPVVQEVIKKINEIFHFDATRIFLLNPQMDELQMQASFETRPEFWAQVRSFRRGQGIVGRVADRGERILFDDVRTDPRYQEWSQSKASQKAGFAFLAGFPIKTKERTVGTLLLVGQSPRKLTGDEVQLLTSMAEQVGVAVENSGLFEQVVKKSKELEALVEINKDIAALLDREVLLPRIAEEARNLLKMDGANFRLIEGEHLVLAGESGSENLSLRPRLRLDESLSGKVVQENRAVAVRDFLEDPTIIEAHRETMRKAGYHSFLGVPLRVAGRIIGTINLYSKEEREFRPEEINPITSFADQAAIAIQNANLFAEVKQKTVELEGANREIVEASRAKSEFLAAMSHELRTPLNVIIGNTDLMKDRFFGEVTEKQQEALEKILRYSRVLLKLINDVLALTRIEAKKMSLDVSTFSLEEVVAHVRTYVEQMNHGNRLRVLWDVEDHFPLMNTDALKVEEILQNLIGNAFKFTPKGQIEIRIRDLIRKKRIEFSVSDTGIGIEEGELEKIFGDFYQFKEAHTGAYSGVGLGLSIVKKYLDLLQGDIHVQSQPLKGSTFSFTLPYSI